MDFEDHQKMEANYINYEGHQPASAPVSRALSDGSRDETPSHTYKHSWTVEQRLTLTMLAESYSNKWSELTKVFNHVHKSDLRRCGGLRTAVVSTQYCDMRRKAILLSPYDRSRLVSAGVLEKKAREVGVRLIKEMPTDTLNRGSLSERHDAHGRNKRKRVHSFDDGRTDFLPDNQSGTAPGLQTLHDLPAMPKTPTKTNAKQQYGLLTPRDSRRRKQPRIVADKRLASIGFRAFTTASQGKYTPNLGIRAGGFLNCPNIPLARDLEVTRYREEALLFVSATKNPMRALHMLLHGPQGEKILILIDLKLADELGNVQRASDLKLRPEFRYTAAGEYLIFGGVDPKAIISQIPLSDLLSQLPTLPDDDDPFRFKVLQAQERLSYARGAVKRGVPPMTHSLGRAVGQLVGILCIPPRHFESGVWAIVQDYKFYSAEGGKRVLWANNSAFKDGALQAYQAHRPYPLASLQMENSIVALREIIEIDDSDSDSVFSSNSDSRAQEDPAPVEVEEWLRESTQYYDLETGTWMTKDEELSDTFLTELEDFSTNLDHNGPGTSGNILADNVMDITDDPFAVPARNRLEEFKHLDELCADLMHMHGDESISSLRTGECNIDNEYEFSWTGM